MLLWPLFWACTNRSLKAFLNSSVFGIPCILCDDLRKSPRTNCTDDEIKQFTCRCATYIRSELACNITNFRYNPRMNMPLKISKIGNSAGIILPKELLARLRVELGDTLYASETPEGFRLTASNPDFEAKMAMAETIMREDRDILRVLAQ